MLTHIQKNGFTEVTQFFISGTLINSIQWAAISDLKTIFFLKHSNFNIWSYVSGVFSYLFPLISENIGCSKMGGKKNAWNLNQKNFIQTYRPWVFESEENSFHHHY